MKHKLLLTTSFLLCLTCLVSNLFAVTYTSINGGDWNDPIAWQGGIIPPTTILTTDIVIIDGHNIYMNVDVTNNGTIQLNDGTATYFNINVGKTLTNSTTGNIVAVAGSQGIGIFVEGNLINAGTITIDNLGTYFAGDVGSTVTNMSTGSIMQNNGDSYFLGSFNNSGQFSLDNQSSTSIEAGGTFTNTSSGSVSLASEAVFTVKGTLINNNLIEAFDFANITTTATPTITNSSTGTIVLLGSSYMELTAFTGTAMMSNSGTIIIDLNANCINSSSAQFTNTASGTVTNGGIFYNNGIFANAGTFYNNYIYSGTGTFSGTLFDNSLVGIIGNNLDDDCMTFSNGFTNNGTIDVLLSNPGTTPVACTDFDKITVIGTATLGGELLPTLISGLEPEVGDVYVILTATAIVGTFSNNTIDLNNGTYANVTYTSTEVVVTITAPVGPTAFNVTGGGTLCGAGAELEVGLDGSEVGVAYQLQLAGVDVGTAVSGDGFAITFGNHTATGTYTVIATDIASSTTATMTGSVDIVTGIIPAAPTITLSGSSTVCTGASVTLTGVGTGGTADQFAWFKNGNFVKYSTSPSYTINATTGSSNYTLVVIHVGEACPSPQSTTSTVITGVEPAAVITPSTMPPYCVNTAPVLNANTGTGYTYSWIGTSSSAATATSSAFTPTASGNHRVIVTDANGCKKSSGWLAIALNPLPGANAGTDKNVCLGSSIGLGTTATAGYSYSWSPSISLSSATSATPTFTPSAIGNTNYTVTVTNTTTGCRNTDAVGVSVVAIPTTPSLTSTSSPVCQGATITLIPSGATGAINWYKNGVLSSAAATAAQFTLVASTASADSYTIRAKSGTCLSVASNPVSAWIKPAPVPTLSATPAIVSNVVSVCNPGQTSGTAQLMVNLPSGAPTAAMYNWQQVVAGTATSLNPAATTSTYTAAISTAANNKTFRAEVTYSNSCIKSTSNVTVKMLPSTCTIRTGHSGDLAEEIFTAYPNPTENVLHVNIQNSKVSEGELVLYNTLGQAITSRTISLVEGRYEDSFDLSELALGIYTLSFQTKDGNQVQKIVKE